jgi:hypothetical protein
LASGGDVDLLNVTGASASFDAFVGAFCRALAVSSTRSDFDADRCRATIFTKSTDCIIEGTPHKTSRVYYVVDVIGGAYSQRCPMESCRSSHGPWTPLSSDVLASLDTFLDASTYRSRMLMPIGTATAADVI